MAVNLHQVPQTFSTPADGSKFFFPLEKAFDNSRASVSEKKGPPDGGPFEMESETFGSALGELEALAGAGATGLFAFLHAGIAGQESFLLERQAERFVDFEKGAAEREAKGTGLTIDAATGGFHQDIIAVNRIGDFQRTEDLVLKRDAAEVIGEITAIDLDSSAAGLHANACDRGFAASCGLNWGCCFAHGNKDQAGCGFWAL